METERRKIPINKICKQKTMKEACEFGYDFMRFVILCEF